MLGVSRASAGEMLRRLENDGPDRARRAEGGAAHAPGPRARRARRPQAPDRRAAAHRLHGLHRRRGARARRRDRRGVLDDMVARIEERLGHPDRCPHGWPVEPTSSRPRTGSSSPLADLEPGGRAEIVRLAEHDGDLLHWFYDEGLVPGTRVELRAAQPAAGQFTVARRRRRAGDRREGRRRACSSRPPSRGPDAPCGPRPGACPRDVARRATATIAGGSVDDVALSALFPDEAGSDTSAPAASGRSGGRVRSPTPRSRPRARRPRGARRPCRSAPT